MLHVCKQNCQRYVTCLCAFHRNTVCDSEQFRLPTPLLWMSSHEFHNRGFDTNQHFLNVSNSCGKVSGDKVSSFPQETGTVVSLKIYISIFYFVKEESIKINMEDYARLLFQDILNSRIYHTIGYTTQLYNKS